jgi:putative tricarboxylic transport membrane protein
MGEKQMRISVLRAALASAAVLCASSIAAFAAWEPVRPVEFIVPAGTGGGADQMARTIQGIVTKHGLMKQPMVVINK